jgi:uncharacterized membrane protein YedE/YeeE
MKTPGFGIPVLKETNTDYEVGSLDTFYQKGYEPARPGWYYLKYLTVGIFFGIILVKSEVISWFRIQEMFRLQSFHMYGIIGSAVVVGIVSVAIIKKFKIKTINGDPVFFYSRPFSLGQIYGGILFGFGWALTGACPGPLFAQIGAGTSVVMITLLSAIAGVWVYGWIQEKLPH